MSKLPRDGADEMTQEIKVLAAPAWQLELDPRNWKRTDSTELSSTHISTHHAHTHKNNTSNFSQSEYKVNQATFSQVKQCMPVIPVVGRQSQED